MVPVSVVSGPLARGHPDIVPVHRVTTRNAWPDASSRRQHDPPERAHASVHEHVPGGIVVFGRKTIDVIRGQKDTERQEVPARHAQDLALSTEVGPCLPDHLSGRDVLQTQCRSVLVQMAASREQPGRHRGPSFPALDRVAGWQVEGVLAPPAASRPDTAAGWRVAGARALPGSARAARAAGRPDTLSASDCAASRSPGDCRRDATGSPGTTGGRRAGFRARPRRCGA